MSYDWSKFTKRIPIDASLSEIYDSWTIPAELESWFLREAKFTKADGTACDANSNVQISDKYEWKWHGYSDEVVEKGEILEANGKDFFKFTFGEGGIVSVRIFEEQGALILELTQENLPTDEEGKVKFHLGCSHGWNFYMTNLKSLLEGGIDLRNMNQELHDVLNA
jgi:uncharacterized protein YndB with AHSA1/START domain